MTDQDPKDRQIRKLQLANELLTMNLQDMEARIKELEAQLAEAKEPPKPQRTKKAS